MTRKYADDQERISRNILIDASGCWLWLRAKTDRGYGTVQVNGANRRAHRVSYEAFVGPVPDGLELDHLCMVRHCVNPQHLEPVTHRTNCVRSPTNLAGANVRKTECPKGHPYDAENTYLVPSTGRRMCLPCLNDRNARYQAEGRTKALRDARREEINIRRRADYAAKRAARALAAANVRSAA